jgi:myo-inositol-1(or 4)-monophosphatase
VAIAAARAAGEIQRERYERLERIVHKSEKDVVTEVDHLCERPSSPRSARPSPTTHRWPRRVAPPIPRPARQQPARNARHGVPDARPPTRCVGRTGGLEAVEAPAPPPARLWVVDPLDGTINYANGIPLFCTSIALVVHGRPVVGVILDPLRDELFSAIAGRGAWLDGAPIVHPAKERLIDCVVAMSLPGRGWALRGRRVRRAVRVSRVLGSAALELTYVANGRFDAVILPGGLSLWDVAAAGTIAEAAGALVTDSAGGPWFDVGRASRGTGILASSPAHHETLRGMLRDDHT